MTGPQVLLATQKGIPLRNAFLVRQYIRYYDTVSDTWLPWNGNGVTVRFSSQPTGYTPEGYPSTLLGPYVLVLTGPGLFTARIPADDVTNVFGRLVNTSVYQVVEGAYGSSYYDLTDVQPLLVVDPRAPIP